MATNCSTRVESSGTSADHAARPPAIRLDYQKIVNATVAVFVVCGAIAIIEPSPYDFAALVAIPVWFVGGVAVHRSFILFAFLMLFYNLTGFLALVPHWEDAAAAMFMYQSTYLTVTALFFALFVAERTQDRTELCLKAYAASNILAASAGILGYFDVGGLGELFTHFGRASGTFKDPNVLGPFIITGALYLAQNLILARARRVGLSIALLLILVAGVFLSFSRGAWGAFIFSSMLMAASAYVTAADKKTKRRIAMAAFVAVAVSILVVLLLLSMDQTRDLFLDRALLTQYYDEGATGRFGNQLRSLPPVFERFNGFGPLRFRLIFGLEPHNSYIGAFANQGWLGGLTFIILALATTFVGFRLMFAASPYQRQAQVVFPALLAFFLQAFQIDIDHWRHVFLMLGVVWGLEAARQRWELRQWRQTSELMASSVQSCVKS